MPHDASYGALILQACLTGTLDMTAIHAPEPSGEGVVGRDGPVVTALNRPPRRTPAMTRGALYEAPFVEARLTGRPT